MFFALKKKIMCKVLERRKAQKPFDFQYAEGFSLEGEADPMVNNSYYFSAHGESMSVYARLGLRVDSEESWFAVYLGGKLHSLKRELFPAGEAPVRVERDGDRWTLSFKGTLDEGDEAEFSASFIPGQEPIDFTNDMPAVRKATGIANEKWNKAFFGQLRSIDGQCHYEQEGVLEGTLTLNGETSGFRLPCVRDHSFGRRDWNYMNNHLWLMAVSDGCQFNYSMVSYPAMSVMELGNYRDGARQHYWLRADLDLEQVGKGTVPGGLSFAVCLDDGRTISIAARVLAGVTYRFQDGQYVLHENIAEFTIDGKVCRGIFEIGFNGNRNRWFNQRALSGIKR